MSKMRFLLFFLVGAGLAHWLVYGPKKRPPPCKGTTILLKTEDLPARLDGLSARCPKDTRPELVNFEGRLALTCSCE